ncbi:MAG: TPM domain-containing protein [Ignavibacteria bacterium]|nr:TPM domain-containing protein [Ignavibacteria bacterium]
MRKLFRDILLILALLFTGLGYSQDDGPSKSLSDAPPTVKKYVVDETGTLTSSQINSLMTKLVNFEKATTNQIIVYLIPSLNGEPIENVAVEIARKNKIGKKDNNNGVLVLVAMKDRKMRIEVGYGLEGALTDAISSQIIRNDMQPEFKKGNYYEGLDKAVDDIIAVTKGEYAADKKGKKNETGSIIFVIVMFLMVIGFIIFAIIRKASRFGRRMVTGSRGSGLGDVATGFLIGSLFNNSGWSSGSSGSDSGSSGSDFGSFSGGGGDFGGGGASGDW